MSIEIENGMEVIPDRPLPHKLPTPDMAITPLPEQETNRPLPRIEQTGRGCCGGNKEI